MTALAALVAAELAEPVDPAISALAEAITARVGAVEAVLFYGSGLRGGATPASLLDFYVVVSDYRAAYVSGLLAWLNRVLPPNVFNVAAAGLRAKYAVVDRAGFDRLCSDATDNPAVWARFAQTSRLVWASDAAARERTVGAVAKAAPALLSAAAPLLAGPVTAAALWEAALNATFATELRAEPPGRAAAIVAADPARYAAFAGAILPFDANGATVLPAADARAARRDWARRRRRGKALSALRLLKAALTFDGGLDYLAAKVERHSGVGVPVKAWHRRWPVLGGLALLPRLLAKGAVR